MKAFILASIFFGIISTHAEARSHHHHRNVASNGLSVECNVTMPCVAPYASTPAQVRATRGKYVASQMGFGGPVTASAPRRHRKARRHNRHLIHVAKPAPADPTAIGNGIVRAASGAVAYVAGRATTAFQCVVDKLEAEGYPVKFMGGFANRGHIRHSLHYSGLALDVNQVERNVTTPRMPSNEIAIANGCGLISGAQWANGDSGHFQLGGWAGGARHYARRRTWHRYASRWRHRRYANR